MARMKKRMSSMGLQPARRAARLIVGAAGALACTAVLAQGTAPAEAPTVLEGASLAAQMGCVNCHGAQPRGDAPSFKSLQDRAARGDRDPAKTADHWLEEIREIGSGGRGVVVHRQVSDASAKAIAQWLARPANKPVN